MTQRRLPQWLDNVSIGAVRGLFELATRGTQLAIYGGAATLVGATSLDPRAVSTWALALLGYDFLYYWAHRAAHRSPILWTTHAVHHQGTEMNLTVGLRAGILNSFVHLPFFLVLAALGVPGSVYLGVSVIHLVVMTWLHTERVGALPRLERWFNTPALHRVHHSAAPEHLDTNFGGVLIVWDRLFGTYAPVAEVTRYGVVGEDDAPGLVEAHVRPWRQLFAQWRKRSEAIAPPSLAPR